MASLTSASDAGPAPSALLLLIGAVTALAGLIALAAPAWFFETVPGLAMMGPFHVHLVRDVGLTLLASGLVMGWGGARRDWRLAAAGALWPMLHMLFHLQLWLARGAPLDAIFLFDLIALFIPSVLVVMAILSLRRARDLAR